MFFLLISLVVTLFYLKAWIYKKKLYICIVGMQTNAKLFSIKTFNPYLGVLHHEGVGVFNLVYMESFRVVCRNDRAMPEGFPAAYWIKKDQVYTVVEASLLDRQNMVVGYKLAEIDIPEDCVYKFFLAMRFRPYDELDAEAEEAVAELLKEVDDLILV